MGSHRVLEAITLQLEMLECPDNPPSSDCCIFKVPHRLKRVNQAAYIPSIVSIGPLHHGKRGLKKMEETKMRFLNDFLKRTNVNLQCFIEIVEKRIERLRSCYEEVLEFTDEKLVEIFVVDAVFVIGSLLGFCLGEFQNYRGVLLNVRIELLMLENQLPFFILEELFNLLENQLPFSILKEILKKLSNFATEDFEDLNSLITYCYIFFLSIRCFEGKEEYLKKIHVDNYKPDHLVDLLRKFYGPLNPSDGEYHETELHTPTITELHQAGAKFKVGSAKNLLDIRFSKGTLEIPKLRIFDSTDSILRNLIAFEQCHVSKENYISDYASLMDRLINTPEDVELLVKNKIILNWLGENRDVSSMMNRIGDGVLIKTGHFYFAPLCKELDSYSEKPRNKWKATLKQRYFNTPWAGVSAIAAVLLIVLTIIQTICSVISVVNGD